MKISDILARVDEIKPNDFDDNTKIDWVSELDAKIFNTVVMTHEHEKNVSHTSDMITGEETITEEEPKFIPYVSEDAEVILDETHADVYRHWLYAMMDYANGETERYKNSMLMFNSVYQEFANLYNSTHLPIQRPLKII